MIIRVTRKDDSLGYDQFDFDSILEVAHFLSVNAIRHCFEQRDTKLTLTIERQ